MLESVRGPDEKMDFKGGTLIEFHDNRCYENCPTHWHNSLEIIMPIENTYCVVCNQIPYHLQKGDVLIIQPTIPHKTIASHGRRLICLVSMLPIYSIEMCKSLYLQLPSIIQLTAQDDAAYCEQICKQLNLIHQECDGIDQTSELSKFASILHILSLAYKAYLEKISVSHQETIEQQILMGIFPSICIYISTHYAEKLTLEHVAQKSGYSKYHFGRLFKKYTNETFYQFLNKIRMQNAQLLIREYDTSIFEVANECGFSSVSSFIRMFKIYHNCTPSKYREVHSQMTRNSQTGN